jgi:hypothetical protein
MAVKRFIRLTPDSVFYYVVCWLQKIWQSDALSALNIKTKILEKIKCIKWQLCVLYWMNWYLDEKLKKELPSLWYLKAAQTFINLQMKFISFVNKILCGKIRFSFKTQNHKKIKTDIKLKIEVKMEKQLKISKIMILWRKL